LTPVSSKLFAFLTALALPVAVIAAPPPAADPAAAPEAAPEPVNWGFRKADRPVKVVVIAGSVGAWLKQPYAKRFEQMCPNIEVKNLSKVGQGAGALKTRFREQVIENRRLNFGDDALEYWLVFQGGLNSVAMPERTNRYIRDLNVLAHRRGMSVVNLSLTPWGDTSDRKRWSGGEALKYFDATRKIVDFAMGRLDPQTALGSEVSRRQDPDAPWSDNELPDVSIDLYDSPLRNAEATATPIDDARRALERDSGWKRKHSKLSEAEREAALDRDARTLSEIPRWWMKTEYRAFDHIHPNTDGHDVIARWACPALPESWGCSCPDPGVATARRGPSWTGTLDPADPIR
jgi:hypothetical protein